MPRERVGKLGTTVGKLLINTNTFTLMSTSTGPCRPRTPTRPPPD